MDTFEIIQHPLDWLSFTGSMAGLDAMGGMLPISC